MKQKKKPTMLEKKIKYGSPAAYYRSKCHKAAVQFNQELNHVELSTQENTTDLSPEFSKTVDEYVWELV